MSALTDALEAATGRDRGLDGDVAEALGLVPNGFTREGRTGRYTRGRDVYDAPDLTGDMRVSKVHLPDGWSWHELPPFGVGNDHRHRFTDDVTTVTTRARTHDASICAGVLKVLGL